MCTTPVDADSFKLWVKELSYILSLDSYLYSSNFGIPEGVVFGFGGLLETSEGKKDGAITGNNIGVQFSCPEVTGSEIGTEIGSLDSGVYGISDGNFEEVSLGQSLRKKM